jgi:hypothetical protein
MEPLRSALATLCPASGKSFNSTGVLFGFNRSATSTAPLTGHRSSWPP